MTPHLKDIIVIKEWQKMQDHFSQVTKVGLRTIDAQGNLVCPPSGLPKLCTELFKNLIVKPKACETCLPTFLGGIGVVDKNLSFSCISGVHNFITPLKVAENILGYLVIGPVILLVRHPKEYYLPIAQKLHISLEDFWSAIVELKVVSVEGAHSLIELVKDIADYVQKLALQSMREVREEGVLNNVRVHKLFDALLEFAIQVSGASAGSIMVFDKMKETLTIQTSRGLNEEVARNTTQKLGEGVAGVAARERKSFLINQEQSDNRITQYLKRPEISSSMVVPIGLEGGITGVMNLATHETASQFTEESLNLISKLVRVVDLAFQK